MGLKLRGKVLHPKACDISRPIQPHVLLFLFVCVLYFTPLWLVSISSFGKGGVLAVGQDANYVMEKIGVVYLLGFTFFLLGSWSVPKLCWLLGAKSTNPLGVARFKIYRCDYILLLALVACFIFSKLLLIPTGVYSNYAFDTGSMDSPVWTASMFLSEALVLTSIMALFSKERHNVLLFCAISAINGVNLLHGTRNFFVIAIFAMVLYVYTQSKLSLVKLSIYGAVAFLGAVSLGYVVYLNRSHTADAGFTLLDIFSPIVFESVFSQMSLVSLLNHPILIPSIGNPFHLLQDVIAFTTPRFLFDGKDDAVWLNQFGYLSQLGAFNGFAAGLLYFGYLFPIFYYFVGLTAGFLYRWATNQYGIIIYIYFACDFIYRIARDGYVIPFKMLLNTIEIIIVLVLFRALANATMRRIRLNYPSPATTN